MKHKAKDILVTLFNKVKQLPARRWAITFCKFLLRNWHNIITAIFIVILVGRIFKEASFLIWLGKVVFGAIIGWYLDKLWADLKKLWRLGKEKLNRKK